MVSNRLAERDDVTFNGYCFGCRTGNHVVCRGEGHRKDSRRVASEQPSLKRSSSWRSSRRCRKRRTRSYPGQIVFDFKGAGEVVPTQQQVEALRSGMIDMILTAASYYTSIMPEMDVMSLIHHDALGGEAGRGL